MKEVHFRQEMGTSKCGQYNSFNVELDLTDNWRAVTCDACIRALTGASAEVVPGRIISPLGGFCIGSGSLIASLSWLNEWNDSFPVERLGG